MPSRLNTVLSTGNIRSLHTVSTITTPALSQMSIRHSNSHYSDLSTVDNYGEESCGARQFHGNFVKIIFIQIISLIIFLETRIISVSSHRFFLISVLYFEKIFSIF